MLIRFRRAHPLLLEQALIPSLHLMEKVLAEMASQGLLHRNFIALAFAEPRTETTNSTWSAFENHLCAEAWLGPEADIRNAKRDYMANAGAKTFTSWRLEVNNGLALQEWCAGQRADLIDEDSRWPGAIFWPGTLAGAGSVQQPEQDEWFIQKTVRHLLTGELPNTEDMEKLKGMTGKYKSIYPPDGIDTVGGGNFDRPPNFKGFQLVL